MNKNFTFLMAMVMAVALASGNASAHPGHGEHPIQLAQGEDTPATTPAGITGQSPFTFRTFQTRDILPEKAQEVLPHAHGGFAVDRRPGQGEVYFSLPGAGIIRISNTLDTAELIPTPEEMRDTNLHNTSIWYAQDGTPYLVFPGNDVGKVFTTTLDGELVNTLVSPGEDKVFDEAVADGYFALGEKFVPTDVDELDGLYYITTGYSNLDYVLTAKLGDDTPPSVAWNDLAFGGRGEEKGKFGTGHGVTISPDGSRVDIADRPNGEIDRFTRYGHYRETIKLPEGAWPCDIDYAAGYALVGCLHGPDRSQGAPVYLMKEGAVLSTILPKEDLGLDRFTHIHNAVLTEMNGKLYIIAQAWNPGDFVILEQVK
jgi:hypothetical protein